MTEASMELADFMRLVLDALEAAGVEYMIGGADPPATPDALEELVPFAVQFRYTLYMNLDFYRQADARLAREFIEWAHAVIEAPVRSGGPC